VGRFGPPNNFDVVILLNYFYSASTASGCKPTFLLLRHCLILTMQATKELLVYDSVRMGLRSCSPPVSL